jgi:hydrogenase large subunit
LITEQVIHSWYNDADDNLNPASGATNPVKPKPNAYSWLKAVRFNGLPHEVGPLARMTVNGDYSNGISVMDRHRARAYEALKIAQAMQGWLDELNPSGAVYSGRAVPASATSMGLSEAPRGALGHWLRIANQKISHYQVITPTTWNAGPRGTDSTPGPMEFALIGCPVENLDEPIEVMRIIHSFDPCLDCAVHVIRPKAGARVFAIPHTHGETVHSHDHSHAEGGHRE